MSVAQMRTILMTKTKYGKSPKWLNRVSKMSDNQIVAVYYRMLYAGELG